MKLIGVGIPFLILSMALVVATEDSNNERKAHKISSSMVLANTRSDSSNSDSTEQLSGDGHDEARRLKLDRTQWEGTFEMVANEGVTTAEKIEAFWAIIAAVITAILSNIMTKVTVLRLSS